MHPIRQHIIQSLILKSRLHFAELKPPETESNHFIYYLKQLTKEGLVTKDGECYCLSDAGKQYASIISLETLTPRLQPKIMTAIVVFKDNQVLLHIRKREPYFNKVTLVNGKLHYGEAVQVAAERELKEKTGLKADLTHIGMVYLNTLENGKSVNHNLSHIFMGKNPQGELLKENSVSQPIWVNVAKVDKLDLLEGTKEILACIHEPPFFFKEFDFEI